MFVDEKAVGEKQPVQVGTLKLSAAMRIGAAMREQCKVQWFEGGRSCALGAAYEGAGRKHEAIAYKEQEASWPYAQAERVFGVNAKTIRQVYERNDCGETREQIADWLESQGY